MGLQSVTCFQLSARTQSNMMFLVVGHNPNSLLWDFFGNEYEEDGVTIKVHFGWEQGPSSRRINIQKAESYIRTHPGFEWLTLSKPRWIVDLDSLREQFTGLRTLDWLRGKVALEPDIEREEKVTPVFDTSRGQIERRYVILRFVLVVTQDTMRERPMSAPVEIQESLARFREDHPTDIKVAFIMMRFGSSQAHERIVAGIKESLAQHGVIGLRADDKQYHDDILWNIVTYIYGCGFGVAVFERLLTDDFNPNVSLEVGYMMALRKQVCLLKDQTLPKLQTDLVGRLYRPFDTQDPVNSIVPQLEAWIKDKGIVRS
jgi:hypothetical protein